MAKILITPRSLTREGDPALDVLKKAGYELVLCTPGKSPDEEELIRLLPGCAGWLAGVEKITQRVLSRADCLKVISRNGTGVDSIDLEACRKLGIAVLKADGANARGVAELTLALLLSLIRSLPFSDARMKSGGWERRQGTELEGRVLGVIGCGKIGKLVTRFAMALDMTVLAFDAFPDTTFSPGQGFRWVSKDEALRQADAVTLHCPHTPGEPPLLDRAAISSMKKGAFIINTARSGLVDRDAVLEGIQQGRLGGYAVDAYDQEPPEPHPLFSNEKVITTPHIGAFTAESVSRATRAAVDNLLEALDAR